MNEHNIRELFVFAGQSNMMGAAVLPPEFKLNISNSYEYKYKNRRFGNKCGKFIPVSYNIGEFAYCDLKKAYPTNDYDSLRELSDFTNNTYFVPALCNLDKFDERSVIAFSKISEKTAVNAPSLPPYFVNEWEKMGRKCAIAHMAKGNVTILHYFDEEMVESYNKKIVQQNDFYNTKYPLLSKEDLTFEPSKYFSNEIKAFFEDASERFDKDIIKTKAFVWLQGESDAKLSEVEYRLRLEILWGKLKMLGFTHFLCIRVGMWGEEKNITEIMKAQEKFCAQNKSCYMLTRSCSFMTFPEENKNLSYLRTPDEKYFGCRDSFFGFANDHINEKGHILIAKQAIANVKRVLIDNDDVELEEEIVKELV